MAGAGRLPPPTDLVPVRYELGWSADLARVTACVTRKCSTGAREPYVVEFGSGVVAFGRWRASGRCQQIGSLPWLRFDLVSRCFAGLAGEGSGEVSAVVNPDLAEDGLGVVAHGVRRQEQGSSDVIA